MDNVFVDKKALQHVVDEMLDREKQTSKSLLALDVAFMHYKDTYTCLCCVYIMN